MPFLDIPLVSQWGIPSDERYINDCGPACVAMILEYFGRRGTLTADQLATETPLRVSDTGLMPIELVRLLALHNTSSHVKTGVTVNQIKAEIDALRPVICLIEYRYILGRLDKDPSGHFVLAEGYDDTHIIMDDPDYWIPYLDKGHNYLAPVIEFQRAIGFYGGQCIFLEESMTLPDQIKEFATQITTAADQIKALADQLSTTPLPPVPISDPLPGVQKTSVLATTVNVRDESMNVIGQLTGVGDMITYQGALAATVGGAIHTFASVLAVNGEAQTYSVGGKTIYGRIATDVAFPKA